MSEQRADFNPLQTNYTWDHDNLRHWCSLGLNLQDEMRRIRTQGRVLEVGVGKGEHAVLLRHYGFTVVTLDVNPQNTPDLLYDLRVPFYDAPNNQYHAITCHHTLEHLPFDAVPRILVDFHRMLKPGGWLFLTLPCRSRIVAGSFRFARWFKSLVKRQLKTFTTSAFHYWEISKQYPPADIENLLDLCDYVQVETKQSHYNPFEMRFIAQKQSEVLE